MNTVRFAFTPCAILLAGALAAACGGTNTGAGGTPTPGGEGIKEVTAVIEAKSGSTVSGTAVFTADGDKVTVKIDVAGAPAGEHAVHIHEVGDCSSPDGKSAGEHWNPTAKPHGKFGHDGFHLGDIGNMKVGDDGKGTISLSTEEWSLGTGAMDDVIGHSIIVHAQPDDFTTQPSGAAGDRIGCAVIRKPQ